MNCDSVLETLKIAKGTCCADCHMFQDDYFKEEFKWERLEIGGKTAYVCCNVYKKYKELNNE